MTIEQIEKKLMYGDYNILAAMLGINSAAAKMRFKRGDKQAADALVKIIENREKLIKENAVEK